MVKKCTICKVTKSWDEFYKRAFPKKGVSSYCKKCQCLYKRDKAKQKISVARWTKDNPDRMKVIYARYRHTEKHKRVLSVWQKKNPDKIRLYVANWRKRNLDKVRARYSIYCKNNRAKLNAKGAKRRAKKHSATPPWLTEQHFKKIKDFYFKAEKMTLDTGVPHEVDHIVPLQGKNVCGLHVPWNLQVITASENCKKGIKLIGEK